MKKVIVIFVALILSVNLWADDNDYGSKIKLTDSEAYALKKPATRASGKGTSMRENIARQKAMDDARGALSQSLEMAIMNASKTLSFDIEQYSASDDDGASLYEGGSRSNNLVKTISQNVLKGTPVVKTDKFYKKKNRMYTVFVCVEYSGGVEEMAEEAVKELKNRISDKDRARIDSELDKWQKEIENELENQSADIPVEDEDE